MPQSRPDARVRHPRHERRGEARLPGVLATLTAIALYLALPQQLLIAPRYVLPTLEILLLIPLIAINPRRLTRQTRVFRVLSLTLVGSLCRRTAGTARPVAATCAARIRPCARRSSAIASAASSPASSRARSGPGYG
ncbi:hypothetical protein ACFV99_19760 [Streptomyces sp. NPDC059944]|uniref:hypothetical protein n=1 Tax=unclassified Streptomyces TaxID=2593676 RepID=UPI003635E90C